MKRWSDWTFIAACVLLGTLGVMVMLSAVKVLVRILVLGY